MKKFKTQGAAWDWCRSNTVGNCGVLIENGGGFSTTARLNPDAAYWISDDQGFALSYGEADPGYDHTLAVRQWLLDNPAKAGEGFSFNR